MRALKGIAWLLVIVGALNWGLWGFFQFDFVAWLFKGNTTWLARLVYAVIGLAGLLSLKAFCCCCCKKKCACGKENCNCGGKSGGCGCRMQ